MNKNKSTRNSVRVTNIITQHLVLCRINRLCHSAISS